MVQMVAAVTLGSGSAGTGGAGTGTILANSLTPTGVAPFKEAKNRLAAGTYFIYNLATNAQIVVYERSERTRVVGPIQLWNGPTINQDTRKWNLRFTDDGYALISSTWPPPGPERFLAIGPNVRPIENRCRLFGISRQEGYAYYICTDADPTISPPLVVEDPQAMPLDASTACTSRFEINNRNQMWMFAKAP